MTRVADPKSKKYTSLLNWILQSEEIEIIFHVKIRTLNYELYQLKSGAIIVSSSDMFYFHATDFDDMLKEFSLLDGKETVKDDIEIVKSTVIDNEEDTRYEWVERGGKMVQKVDEEFFPKRFSKRSGIRAFGKAFYVAKKKPDGIASKYTYQVYSWESRLLLFSHEEKDFCEAWINFMYPEIQHLDY